MTYEEKISQIAGKRIISPIESITFSFGIVDTIYYICEKSKKRVLTKSEENILTDSLAAYMYLVE